MKKIALFYLIFLVKETKKNIPQTKKKISSGIRYEKEKLELKIFSNNLSQLMV